MLKLDGLIGLNWMTSPVTDKHNSSKKNNENTTVYLLKYDCLIIACDGMSPREVLRISSDGDDQRIFGV